MSRYAGTLPILRLDLRRALASVSALLFQRPGPVWAWRARPCSRGVPLDKTSGDGMNFKLTRVEWDRKTQRAYVELRSEDPDGGEAFAVATFSYRRTEEQTKNQRQEDLTRKARNVLKRAGIAA